MEIDSFPDRISNLQAELKKCGNEIMTHISGLYSDENVGTMNLKNGPRNAIKLLQHDVIDCLQLAQERSNIRHDYMPDVNNCRSLIEIISKVSEIATKISQAEETVRGSNILLACRLISEVKNMLTEIPAPNTEIGTGEVCKVLRKEARLLQARLLARIKRLLGNCIVCECGRLSITKRLEGMLRGCSEDSLLESPIELSYIWAALVSLDSAEESANAVVDTILKSIIFPLWREKRAQAPHSFSSEERSEILFDNVVRENSMASSANTSDTTRFGIPSAVTVGSCRMPFPQLLEQISQILSFMWTEVFCGNTEVMRFVSGKLFTGPSFFLTNALNDVLISQIPKSEQELLQYQKSIEKPCKDFESKLVILGLQNSDVTANTHAAKKGVSLSELVADLSARYASMRRREVLSRGRSLLLSDYHNTMLAAGDAIEDDPSSAGDVGDPTAVLEQSGCFSMQALQFESCQVSLASCRMLKLIHEVMKQACVSSRAVASILFLSARDCLELFLAIIPVRFGDIIDTVPRMAAVLYNDSCYIAHNCTLITHMYKEDLGKVDASLQDNSGFIDFILKFRAMGEACLSKHVEEQGAALALLITRINLNPDYSDSDTGMGPGLVGAGGLLKEIGGRIGSFANRKSSRVIGSGSSGALSDVQSSIRGHSHNSGSNGNDEEAAALIVRHFERLKGQWHGVLQEAVYERVVGYLYEQALRLAMQPILDAGCITESAGGDIARVFRTLQKGRSAFATSGADDESLCKIVGSWSKFCALTDLLECSLSEVAEWLPRRKFASFAGSEMSNMIRALFEESPRRKGILNSILEMST